ncbi:MAG TPA: hypothetical protein VJO99_24840 [Burkholderiaceae bacterium]|nr:hypothetical protein [Burkholderiaceae bacterium]
MPARIVAIALVSVAYLALSQWLMISAPESPWNAAALLVPMLAAAAAGAWAAGQRVRSLLAAGAIAALCLQAAFGVLVPAPLLYLAQHVVINLMLGWWFGASLRDGHEALITRLASLVHREMTPAMAAYTRNVTRAWVAYFVAISLGSLLLFALASFETWTWYANIATPIALAAMFVGERLLRFRLHPEFERSSVADMIRAYRQAFPGGHALPASSPSTREPRS